MCTGFSVYFGGITIFRNNTASALLMYSCKAYFGAGSHVEFINNRANADGGAILMFGESVLYVMDNSTFLFINNSAKQRGGAIMSSSSNVHDFLSLKNCFIKYMGGNAHIEDRSLHFEFQGNSAKYGHAIYASTLKPCQRLCVDWQFKMSNWTASSQRISIQTSLV
jgi:predicted outer membrane repeat protein